MQNLRQKLIETMFVALYTKGYHALNLNQLLADAGTSKGGMYHHFTSKKALALESIETVLGAYIERVWIIPLKQSENPLQKLYDLIKALSSAPIGKSIALDFHYGCPINNFIQELSAIDEDFSLLLRKLIENWKNSIMKSLMRVRKNLRIDVDIEHSSAFIIASIEGAFSYAKVYNSKDEFDILMQQLIEYVKSLVRY